MEIKNNKLLRVEKADIIGGVFNIPDAITAISDCAFYGYAGLTSVVIQESVTSIGKWAFSGCTSLESINIPDSVESIGYCTFEGCKNLKSIVIPNSVKSIGNCAFCGCTSLKSITIPNSVKSIGDRAFEDCTDLKSMNIPNSVKWIGNLAFSGCTGLTSHNINKSDVIDLAISLLPVHDGLCSCLDEATRIMSIRLHTAISVQSTFPNFNREIAIAKFGGRMDNYWWPKADKENRINFLEYLRYN